MAGDAVSELRVEPTLDGHNISVGVIAARFNDLITFRLIAGVQRGLVALGAAVAEPYWVPGAFEVPLAAQSLARSGNFDAVIGVGCVIRGATTHYESVAGECAAGLMRAGLATEIPIMFAVLTTETLDQALERSELSGGHNVGEEAARGAVEMVQLLRKFRAAQ